MQVTTIKKHVVLGNQVYNDLIPCLLTPLGLLKWTPGDAKICLILCRAMQRATLRTSVLSVETS